METSKENTTEVSSVPPVIPAKQPGVHIGLAIVIAGIIVAGAIYFSQRNTLSGDGREKTIIETLGVNKNEFKACFEEKRYEKNVREDMESAERATAHVPAEQGRGTPYSIIIAKNGTRAEIPGAYPIEAIKGMLDAILDGTAKSQPEINIDPVTENDYYFGSKDAEIVIIEYSDLECPYCARFHQTMHQVVQEYNGKVAWVYRHLPLEQIHPNAFNKAMAAECIGALKGNETFWKYIDDIFSKMEPKKPVFDPLTGETK
jgi:predicted DsbA family dithiol-disulfide isomerase